MFGFCVMCIVVLGFVIGVVIFLIRCGWRLVVVVGIIGSGIVVNVVVCGVFEFWGFVVYWGCCRVVVVVVVVWFWG